MRLCLEVLASSRGKVDADAIIANQKNRDLFIVLFDAKVRELGRYLS